MTDTAIADVRPGKAPTTSPIRLPRKANSNMLGWRICGRPMVRELVKSNMNRGVAFYDGIGMPKPTTNTAKMDMPASAPTSIDILQLAPRSLIARIRNRIVGMMSPKFEKATVNKTKRRNNKKTDLRSESFEKGDLVSKPIERP